MSGSIIDKSNLLLKRIKVTFLSPSFPYLFNISYQFQKNNLLYCLITYYLKLLSEDIELRKKLERNVQIKISNNSSGKYGESYSNFIRKNFIKSR